MPSTLQRWVRPRSASDGSIGVRRAIRQTIFEAPTSSTDSIALLRGGIWRMRGVSGLSSWLGALLGRVAIRPGGGRLLGQPHEHPAWNPQIERQHVASPGCGTGAEG